MASSVTMQRTSDLLTLLLSVMTVNRHTTQQSVTLHQ
jgi:hypothetical protein